MANLEEYKTPLIHSKNLLLNGDCRITQGITSKRPVSDLLQTGNSGTIYDADPNKSNYNVRGIRWAKNGNQLVTAKWHDTKLYLYDVSKPYTLDGFTAVGNVNLNGILIYDFYISPDGTKLFTIGVSNTLVYEYSITGGDVSTASFVQSHNILNDEYFISLEFKPDGTNLLYTSRWESGGFDYIYFVQLELGSPWDLSDVISEKKMLMEKTFSTNQYALITARWNHDGSKLNWIENTNPAKLKEYSVLDNYTIIHSPSTIVTSQDMLTFPANNNSARGLAWNPDHSKLIVGDTDSTETVYEYILDYMENDVLEYPIAMSTGYINGSFTGMLSLKHDQLKQLGNFVNSLICNVETGGVLTGTGIEINPFEKHVEGHALNDLINNNGVYSFWFDSNVNGTFCVRVKSANNWKFFSTFTYTGTEVPQKYTIDLKTILSQYCNSLLEGEIGFSISIAPISSTDLHFAGSLDTWTDTPTGSSLGSVTNWASTDENYIRVTGFQLEEGTESTEFEYKPYQIELDNCRRFYREIDHIGSSGWGSSSDNFLTLYPIYFNNRMAREPDITIPSFHDSKNISSVTVKAKDKNGITLLGNGDSTDELSYWYIGSNPLKIDSNLQ